MRKCFIFYLFVLFGGQASFAQLTGTKNIPGDYPDLSSAITDLNTSGVGLGGVTLNIVAGNPQTAPAGGYVIGNTGSAVLSSTSSTKQIIIQGNNNLVTAFSPQTTGNINDAVFKIIGADWVTIKNFIIQENAANTTSTIAANNMTEWGVALLYASTIDGAQNNTIRDNSITLNRVYQNSIGVYSSTRHNASDPGIIADITNFTGSNSYNKIYTNVISNVSGGIAFLSSMTPAFMNQENELGGNAANLGNNISNWGHNSGPSGIVDMDNSTIAGIYENNEKMVDIMNNTIISASLNSSNPIYGLLMQYSSPTDVGNSVPEVWFNLITITQTGTGDLIGTGMISTTSAVAYSTAWVLNNYFYNNAVTSNSANMIGVRNTSNATTFLNIYDHIMRNNTSAATTGGFTGIYNTGVAGSDIILGGQIGNTSGGAVSFSNATTAQIYGIRNEAISTNRVGISNSRFEGFSLVSSGGFTAIMNTTPAMGLDCNLNNNQFGSATTPMVTFSAAQSASVKYIVNTTGFNGITKFSASNNTFRGINFMLPSSSPVSFIENTATIFGSIDINTNTFNNITLNTSGDVRFIQSSSAVSNSGTMIKNINTNSIVTGFNKAQPGGVVLFIELSGTETLNSTINIKDNIISNISGTGIASFQAIRERTGNAGGIVPHKFIQNNQITNISGTTGGQYAIFSDQGGDVTISGNTISGMYADGGELQGIRLTSNTAASFIRLNNINTIISSQGADIKGIYTASNGALITITQNKIYNLEASGIGSLTSGITIVSQLDYVLANNLIGDIRTPTASGLDAVSGISIFGGTNVSLYYNTVWINASSTGAQFGTSAVYVSTSGSPINVTLRNNIFVNTSVPNGSGRTAAYRRTGTSLANYAAASNNNLFYAGSPGPSNLIFYDNTNADQTLAAYKVRVSPRDNLSISENPVFISNIGSSANFLHIEPSVATAINGGALPIAGYTTDYDNQTRHASTPDIGADEFTFTPGCPQPTSVSVTQVTSASAKVNFNPTGVNMIVEYGPSGFIPGTAGTPGVGGTIVTGSSSPIDLTGLSSSTNYDVYVRRVCASPPYSSNSAVVSFSTLHMYDEASTAGLLTVGAGCSGAPYNTVGATASSLEKYPSCSGTRQAPIWFKFIAPLSGAVRITTDMGTPSFTNSKIALFSTTDVNDYNTFTILSCDDDGGSVIGSGFLSVLYATALNPGATYYIAVDKYNGSTANGTFCIAVDELDNSMLSTNTACTTSFQVPNANSNTTYSGWIPLLDANSKLMAMVRNPSGGSASSYSLTAQNINTGPIRSSNSVFYLDRNYLINSSATNVQVQFFFLSTELSNLIAADPTVTAGNLGASRQDGNTCVSDFSPLNGWTTFLPQTGNGISADGTVRWIQVNAPSFSNFFLKGSLAGALPTNLMAFSGQKESNVNKLRWTTASESNNLGFEIQRSTDGINYTVISFANTLAMGGNSNDVLNYNYADNNPPGSKQYYRLRQIDVDNHSKFSNIILIKDNKALTLAIAGLFPNPATGFINIMLEAPLRENVTLLIMDAAGQIVIQKITNTERGSNTISIDISNLTNGSYFIKAICSNNGGTAVGKFVKR